MFPTDVSARCFRCFAAEHSRRKSSALHGWHGCFRQWFRQHIPSTFPLGNSYFVSGIKERFFRCFHDFTDQLFLISTTMIRYSIGHELESQADELVVAAWTPQDLWLYLRSRQLFLCSMVPSWNFFFSCYFLGFFFIGLLVGFLLLFFLFFFFLFFWKFRLQRNFRWWDVLVRRATSMWQLWLVAVAATWHVTHGSSGIEQKVKNSSVAIDFKLEHLFQSESFFSFSIPVSFLWPLDQPFQHRSHCDRCLQDDCFFHFIEGVLV